jgi:hypothetical protein
VLGGPGRRGRGRDADDPGSLRPVMEDAGARVVG